MPARPQLAFPAFFTTQPLVPKDLPNSLTVQFSGDIEYWVVLYGKPCLVRVNPPRARRGSAKLTAVWSSPIPILHRNMNAHPAAMSGQSGGPRRRPAFKAHRGPCEPPQIEAHHDVVLAQTMTRWLGLSNHLEPMPRVQVDRALVDASNLKSQSVGALERRPVSNRGHKSVSESGSSMARRYPETSQFSFVGRFSVNAAREANRNPRIEGGEPRIASQPGLPRFQRESALTHHR
jgi:hypothetical protein